METRCGGCSSNREPALSLHTPLLDRASLDATLTPTTGPDQVLRLVRVDGASLYVRKALATLTCHLAAAPANVPILARAGAVSALHDEQESNP